MTISSRYVLIVSMDVSPAAEDLFNEVYDTEHVPFLLQVPGVRAVTRAKGVPAAFAMAGSVRELPAPSPLHTAIYEIDDPAVLASPEWAAAVERGRWPGDVRPHTANRHHALFKVQQSEAMPDQPYGSTIDNRLAVYGTLAPGQPNHHVIAGAGGDWLDGTVHGHLRTGGWGSALGFPGLVPDHGAPAVPVRLLVSEALPSHLARLDAFEGDEYERMRVEVRLRDGATEAWIYALRERQD